ncbi:MAG: decaprenyl-phosphate phosphoribosyltransferase [Muribaculaceae bacterium]|nr:decaprenyl-phosphate phosphoribosyltransferase [Muribaculaceae bacterium]
MKDNNVKWKGIMRLLRPHQWIKNGVVFLAMIFSGRLLDAECWISTILATISFCLVSSSVYCLNDVLDSKYDRLDPVKCKRPVASGMVSPVEALISGAITALLSLIVSILTLPWGCTVIIAFYLSLNILYCVALKHVVLVDVMIVAIGFVLRVVMGGVASQIWLSQWIVIMVFLLALFLALAKRRHEVVLVERSEKQEGRRSVSGYTVPFLNSALSLLGAVLIIGYIMYTLQPKYGKGPDSEYLYITALPVLFGILRYLQLTIVENRSGSPTKIAYSDPPLLITGAIWLITFILIIYL